MSKVPRVITKDIYGIDPDMYSEDYFERGLESGLSCYQNYRWIPELTIPMAMTIIDYLHLSREDKILDFGCAKGFLVKALRLLYRQAWGVDISEYAIRNTDPKVREFCFLSGLTKTLESKADYPQEFDYCIAKDVFEHISERGLEIELNQINSKRIFAIIPLGDSEYYRKVLNFFTEPN